MLGTAQSVPPNSKRQQIELLDSVRRCLLRGPCGMRNPNASCMQGRGECKPPYPKDFQEEPRMLADIFLFPDCPDTKDSQA